MLPKVSTSDTSFNANFYFERGIPKSVKKGLRKISDELPPVLNVKLQGGKKLHWIKEGNKKVTIPINIFVEKEIDGQKVQVGGGLFSLVDPSILKNCRDFVNRVFEYVSSIR